MLQVVFYSKLMSCLGAFIILIVGSIFLVVYRKFSHSFRRIDKKWMRIITFFFIILMVWSFLATIMAGLNLWIYDTCTPGKVESCSLSGESCGIDQAQLTFFEALEQQKLSEWLSAPFISFTETISQIPDRLKVWKAEDYLASSATFYYPIDKSDILGGSKKYAIEVIDPGCAYCKKLFLNTKKAHFEEKYYLSYLIYPIPDYKTATGYKFSNSYLIATYLEAIKRVRQTTLSTPIASDWQLLEKIFVGRDSDNIEWQTKFNLIYNSEEAEKVLQNFLADLGYTHSQIEEIATLSKSEDVKKALLEQKEIVEKKIETDKIPTIIFDGRRYDRVIEFP